MSTAIGAGISGVFGEKPGSGVSAYDNIYSVHFDSPAQRINCGDSSSFSFPGTVASDRAFSISTWVYFVDTAQSVQICGKGDVGTADAEYNLETDSAGRVRIRLYDSNVSSTSTSYWQGRNDTVLETNKWYHIVATFDGTTPNAQSNSIRIYVNNQLNNVVTRVNTPGPFVQMFDNGGKFILGTTDGVNSKNIYMDEAAIFNRALTQADINYLYSIPFTPNLTVNGNFTELGSELILNGDFEELGDEDANYADGNVAFTDLNGSISTSLGANNYRSQGNATTNDSRPRVTLSNSGLSNGKTYKVVYTPTSVTGSTVFDFFENGTRSVNNHDISQPLTFYFTSVSSGLQGFDFDGSQTFSVDYTLSVKEVDPNGDWSLGGAATIENDALHLESATNEYSYARQDISSLAAKTYKIQLQIKNYVSGSCEVGFSGASSNFENLNVTSDGTYTAYVSPNTNGDDLEISREFGGGNFNFDVDNVSVKEISDWTFGDGWTVNSSNQAEYDGTGTTASALEQTVATYEDGKKYQVQFQLDGSLNGVAVSINGGTAVNALRSTTDNSSRSVTVIAGSGSNSLKITPLGATDTFTISDITSKLITSLAAPNTDKDDARAIDLTGMSDLDHWWRMGDTQGPATYPVIHDVVYNPFGEERVDNGNFDELGPQLIKNPLFGLGPELVTCGDFSCADPNDSWDLYESGSSTVTFTDVASINIDGSNSNAGLYQQNIFENSKTYKIVLTMKATAIFDAEILETEGAATRTTIGDVSLTTSYQEFTFYFIGTGNYDLFIHRKFGQTAGQNQQILISNVSVKEVPHWTLASKWSIEGDSARLISNDSNGSGLYQDNIFSANKTYLITFDAVVREGEAKVEKGGGQILQRIDQTGSYSVYLRTVGADAGVTRLYFNRLTSIADVSISNIVAKQVDPNSDWILGTGWSIEDGVANFNGTNSSIRQAVGLQTGKTYKITFTTNVNQGGIAIVLGGSVQLSSVTASGTHTFYGVSGVNTTLYFQPTSFQGQDFQGSIDNVSVQQVSDTSGIMENMNPDNIVAFSPPDPDPLVGDEFIFSVNTAQSGVSNSNQFQLPLISAGTLDFTVIWGDGTQDIITSYNQAETLHTYPSSGTYTIGIRANTEPLKGFKFDSGGDKLKMSNIVNWGGSNFKLDQQEAFYGCSNMTCTATDAPLITATVFYRMFRGCSNFNGDLSNWDVSDVTSFAQMFYSCNDFTGKGLENWDISSANRIDYMFYNCPVFNGQIGGWDTLGVSNMGNTFRHCNIFNQDISSWNTSLVTRMNNMFEDADEFNQPLNSWDVSSCTNFASMFKNATKFNQPLNNWTIKNDAEVDMNAMFFNANAFNQDVSMWDVSRVRYMQYMFFNCRDMSFGFDGWDTSSVDNFFAFADYMDVLDTSFGYLDISSAINIGSFKNNGQTISTDNYNNTLIGWAAQTVNPNLTTSFGSATYSYSAFDARNTLTSAPNNWTITDGGYVPTDNAFQFTVNPNLITLGDELTDITNGTPDNPTHWANVTATSVDFIEVATTGVSYYEDVTPSLEAGEKYKLELTISNYNQIAPGGNMGWSSQNTGSLGGLSLGSNGTVSAYFVSPGGPLRIYGRAGVATASMSFSCKKVNSDTNQFELPLINSGTQDFVVDWGDGEQDKITAWDDAAKLHSYYTYGSELLNVSSLSGPNWTADGSGGFTNNGSGGGLSGSLNVITTPGATYRLTFDVTISGVANASFGGVTIPNFTTSGSKEYYVTATSSSTSFNFYLATAGSPSMFVNNISVVEQTPDTTPKTISIDGTIQGWQFNNAGDYLKLNNINRWGALDIHNTAMFYGCSNMTCTATDAPVVTTTNLYRMFRDCTNFNGAIGNWDVSSVLLAGGVFFECSSFNQPLNDWDTSNITFMNAIFYNASSFNQHLNSWDTSKVQFMHYAFHGCVQFNGDIYSWDLTDAQNMSYMLYNCDSFDQSLAAWNIENVTNLNKIMQNATGLSTSNYNLTLVSWAHQNVNSGLSVDFGGSQYSAGGAAEASRNILTSAPNNWTISDGGSV
jgi:surface protein